MLTTDHLFAPSSLIRITNYSLACFAGFIGFRFIGPNSHHIHDLVNSAELAIRERCEAVARCRGSDLIGQVWSVHYLLLSQVSQYNHATHLFPGEIVVDPPLALSAEWSHVLGSRRTCEDIMACLTANVIMTWIRFIPNQNDWGLLFPCTQQAKFQAAVRAQDRCPEALSLSRGISINTKGERCIDKKQKINYRGRLCYHPC